MLKRLIFLTLLIAPLRAQTMPSPNLAGIAHIALRVKDLDASVAFYQKLGFVKAFDLSRDGKVYEAFIKINDRQFIELYPVDAKNTQVGFLHVCFEAGNIQSVHDYYVAQGLKPIDVRKAGAGNLLFTMPGPMTPQGAQNMEYTQYMPGSLHSNDFGKHLGPDRIATEIKHVAIAFNDPVAANIFYRDKLRFLGAGKPMVGIPGTTEFLDLVDAGGLGTRARLTVLRGFNKGEPWHAATRKELTALGLPFTVDARHNLILLDPDRNEFEIAFPQPI